MQSFNGCIIPPLRKYPKKDTNSKTNLLCKCNQTDFLLHYNSAWGLLTEKPTLLRVRGAASGVLGRGDSLGVSEVELRDELLLENSLLALLKLEVRWRKDSINSVGSLCSPRGGSCRCLCARSLDMTCDSGMPNTWGIVSVWGGRARQGYLKFIWLAQSQLGNELLLKCVSHVTILYISPSGSSIFCTKCLKLCLHSFSIFKL